MRSPKRVYSTSALEAWFCKLNKDWERYFEPDTLHAGQRLYTRGVIREVELGVDDAIIRMKVDGESFYAVIEWDGTAPEVRYSRDDKAAGQILGAAGMYEIEELVAEEANPLPPELQNAQAGNARNEISQPVDIPEERPARPLVVVLDYAANTLAMRAFWELEGKRTAAFGDGSDAELTNAEREQLILLTSYAHRASFRYEGKRSMYLFEDLSALPLFISKDWDRWQKHFDVRVGKAVQSVFDGVRSVDLSMDIAAAGDTLAQVDWKMRAQDVRLNKRDMKKLLRAQDRPVILPGKGLFSLSEKRARAVREWHALVDSGLSAEIPRYMLFSLFKEESVELRLSEDLKAWQSAFYSDPHAIDGLPSFLRDYQRSGVCWLKHLCECGCHALLADEMGLGKTVQILSLLAVRPLDALPSLIVCPASVLPVWEGEVKRFFPHIETRILSRADAFSKEDKGILWLASYSQLRRHKHLLPDIDFAYCVLDEAQFIKNPEAKVTQACYTIQAQHRLALTGTPMENHYQDVWALFRFLMPGLLGSRARFAQEGELRAEAFTGYVRKQIAPFTLRRRKAEVLEELPEKTELELVCPMTDMQQKLYRNMVEAGVLALGNDLSKVEASERMNLLALLTRLRQVSCDPGLMPGVEASLEQSGKLTVLRDRLEELLASGHKVVVFSQFVGLLKRAKSLCLADSKHPVFELTGQTRRRGDCVQAFQKHAGSAVMLISLKAGGTGITLHAADYVFLLDPWWNPAVEAQAIDRVHRLGQKSRVIVYRMIAQNTLEERIQALQANKSDQFEALIGSMEDMSDFQLYKNHLNELIGVPA